MRTAVDLAVDLGVTLGIEPVKRYESHLINTCEPVNAAAVLRNLG